MKYIFLLLVLLNITYTKELPDFIKEWQGVYETSITQNGKTVKQAFQVSNNCFRDDKEGMGEFVCEIGYSQNGSKFDDWKINFYTEKPNDMNYGIVRIINIKSGKEATIKVFSMEYANNFCNIDVEKQNKTIILKSGKCKIDDFNCTIIFLINMKN